MKYKIFICIFILSTIPFILSGCGKKYFFDYSCNWQCDDPYIYIDVEHHSITFTDNDAETTIDAAWAHDGSGIYLINANVEKKAVRTTIKDGKLHIYNLFKKGDEYILKQVDNFE